MVAEVQSLQDRKANFMLFICFCHMVQEWLKPYAAFCFLRDFFETSDHSQWGTFSKFSKDKVLIRFYMPSVLIFKFKLFSVTS